MKVYPLLYYHYGNTKRLSNINMKSKNFTRFIRSLLLFLKVNIIRLLIMFLYNIFIKFKILFDKFC
jgi:hypothetical protein